MIDFQQFVNPRNPGKVSKVSLLTYVIEQHPEYTHAQVCAEAQNLFDRFPLGIRAGVKRIDYKDYMNAKYRQRQQHKVAATPHSSRNGIAKQSSIGDVSMLDELRTARNFLQYCNYDLRRAQALLELVAPLKK